VLNSWQNLMQVPRHPVVSGSKPVPTPALLPVLGVSSKVSNLILSPGSCYVVELSGKFTPVETSGMAPLTPEDTRRIAYELIDGKKRLSRRPEKMRSSRKE
jgi:hypothetical protein